MFFDTALGKSHENTQFCYLLQNFWTLSQYLEVSIHENYILFYTKWGPRDVHQ